MQKDLAAEALWARLEKDEEYELLARMRIRHLVPVREPLVLVSQIQRSGGTLLSQLFDGHPQCHAHPHELTIGFPKSQHWPPLDLRSPHDWFDMLYEKATQKHFRLGYAKTAEKADAADDDFFPFLFPPRLQKAIFDACIASAPIRSRRDVLDAYFTSYFNAWLDNQNLYTGPKNLVTAFAPRLAMKESSVRGLFEHYPDGYLISIVRDPRAWFLSVRGRDGYDDVEHALGRWRQSAEATLRVAEAYPGHGLVVTYEQLALETEATMTRLAELLGIELRPSLLEPTFNGRPIRANSSDAVQRHGVLRDRTSAYRERLDAATIARIDELAGDLYGRAERASFAS
ncbi:MAG TPA: sulfotransferase [Gaiellaceae bacterium]|nr:sulfotransferase [Gaiellaceae bacterium]